MKYHIDPHLNIPAYMQLYRQLRRDIVSGAFAFGSRLPSKRLLAEESSVSVITVQRCYSILSDEGYIEARERSGYFVIYREKDFFARSYLSEDEAKPFHQSGENQTALPYNGSEFPFSVLAKTMRKVMLDYSERLLVKSPNHGCPELRQECCISRLLTAFRVELPPTFQNARNICDGPKRVVASLSKIIMNPS